MHIWKAVLPMIVLASVASAGPTLACHQWVSTPGSVFEALEPLRDAAMSAANHRAEWDAARQRIATLRAEVRPGDALSLLKAGYWISIMSELRLVPDSDGPEMMRQAAAMRPGDAEYQFFAALGSFDNDKPLYKKYWARAQELAKGGSAAIRNLSAFEPELLSRMN
jgi:hypothetical protein